MQRWIRCARWVLCDLNRLGPRALFSLVDPNWNSWLSASLLEIRTGIWYIVFAADLNRQQAVLNANAISSLGSPQTETANIYFTTKPQVCAPVVWWSKSH